MNRSVLLASVLSLVVGAGCGDDSSASGGSGAGAGSGTGTSTGGGGNGGGMGTGGSSSTAGGGVGAPIEAPNETWTWVGFDDAFCANGSATGIGVNLTDASDEVFIYLAGGGACWNALTCYTLGTAVNITSGYGEADFNGEIGGLGGASFFDRSNDANPLKDASFIYVPYCTGDVHGGSATQDYGGQMTMHVGRDNMAAYLERIVPTFPNATRVIISGSSAGGYGAAINFLHTQEVFGDTPVWLLDDSGPFIPPPIFAPANQEAWANAWNIAPVFPADCTGCEADWTKVFGYMASKYPNQRFGLLSYDTDNVIASFHQIQGTGVDQALQIIVDEQATPNPNFEVFEVTGSDHVLLFNPDGISQGGVTALDWITQMLNDDPAWATIQP